MKTSTVTLIWKLLLLERFLHLNHLHLVSEAAIVIKF